MSGPSVTCFSRTVTVGVLAKLFQGAGALFRLHHKLRGQQPPLLLVPLSVFGAVAQMGFRQRMAVCWLLLGVGAASLALGFLQVAQGPESQLRFYEMTNADEAVGFFANRNHFAAFLNVTLVLSALWLTQTLDLLGTVEPLRHPPFCSLLLQPLSSWPLLLASRWHVPGQEYSSLL